MSEWLARVGSEGQLATWLVASFLLYTLASQLACQFQFADLIERLRDHPLSPWAEEAIRFVYYLGIPFMAAVSGLLRADLLGVSGTDWMDGKSAQGFLWEDWARGLGWATLAVLAVVGVWSAGRLVSRKGGLMPATEAMPHPLWQRLLSVLYDQIHWAFYRSGPILWLGDLYWGTFAGFALAALEAGLNPALRWALKSPETASTPLLRLSSAWISALLFVATQNLWLTLATHLILEGLLGSRGADARFAADEPAG